MKVYDVYWKPVESAVMTVEVPDDATEDDVIEAFEDAYDEMGRDEVLARLEAVIRFDPSVEVTHIEEIDED